MSRPVIIIGGGISGLSLAWFLRTRGISALVLERQPRVGGAIQTIDRDGYLVEDGPNSTALSTVALYELICGLGLKSSLLFPQSLATNRFIVKDSALTCLPASPSSFLTSSIFSVGGKLRVLCEPFVAKGDNAEETVAQFFYRRFGSEVVEYAVKPFISGIYAGDADSLSMRASFPGLYELEQDFGSVLAGLIKRRRNQKHDGTKESKPLHSGKSFTFALGLETLTIALRRTLGDKIITSAEEIQCVSSNDHPAVQWKHGGSIFTEEATALVVATPSHSAADLVRTYDLTVADALQSIQYAPITIVHLGVQRNNISHSLNGFGFLVPPIENKNILGCIFSSSLFPGRAPDGRALLTVFIGGSRRPDLLDRSDDQMVDTASRELQPLIGLVGVPEFGRVTRYARAIPQYTIAYTRAMRMIERFETERGNLFFCNNFRGGISIGDCVQSAASLAERLAQG